MYEYNNNNRPQDPWGDPIETTGRPLNDEPFGEPHRKKKGSGKLVALCLVCALVGGIAGGGGVAAATGVFSANRTTLLEGTRPATVVEVSNVTGKDLLTAPEIYAAYVGSTVGITTEVVTTNGWGQPVSQAAAGSGFVITDDGYILTNYHVIEDADSIQVSFIDGSTYDAELVGGESENDIAVLKIEATGLTPVVIGSSDELVVGEPVYAIGNPLGELTFSLTGGYVSALNRNVTMSDGRRMNYIQTDTAINSGNSGGALFNQYGQVVGIVSAKLSSSGSSTEASVEGIGFAIPIDDVKDMITDLIQYGYITGQPYMGIINMDVGSQAQWYGTPAGAYVLGVVDGSCADTAGLQVGDIITAVDDTSVSSSDELSNALKDYEAGDTATLTVSRSGSTVTLTITFDERTDELVAASSELQEEINDQLQQQYQQQQQQQQNNWGNLFPFGW